MFKVEQIYHGRIRSVKDFGFFVKIYSDVDDYYSREGLVHVSQIRARSFEGKHPRLSHASEGGYREGDKIYVQLTQIRDDGKLSLSMRNIDQRSGQLIDIAKSFDLGTTRTSSDELPYKLDSQGRKVGPITGILLEDTNVKINKRSGLETTGKRMPRMNSPDMWELK